MSSNNDPVAVPMIEKNPSDLPGMDTSDPNTLTGEAVLSFHNISYRETVQSGFPFRKKTEEKERLSNVNGIMRPGLNAIMGPEDGSRSWLLDVLAARKDPRGLLGDILINGKPRPANFKCISGYVPQKDVVMCTVTVRDNIEFSAALRLPMTVTRDERRRRIDEVLELLHLDKVANVQPRSKELRKRTSIAMELVAEHPILFLDDPTTDLDLVTTIDVILDMKRMSVRGRTIIFSINQAQYSIFRFFDSLTLVASGKVLYHGPAQEALEYFTSVGYKYDSQNNPEFFFLDIINGGFLAILDTEEYSHDADKYTELSERQHRVTEKLANMFAQSSLYRDMRTELDPLLGEEKAERSSPLEEITCVTPFWHQLWCIICRSFKNFHGFPGTTMIQAIITVILAVIVGTTFCVLRNDCTEVQTRAVLLLLVSSFECTRSMSIRELFIIDRDRFLHEHTSGYYRVPSYFFGKLLGGLVPSLLLRSITFSVIAFSIAGVKTDVKGFFTMLFTNMMLACSASSLWLSLKTREIGAAVPPQLVSVYFLFMLTFLGIILQIIINWNFKKVVWLADSSTIRQMAAFLTCWCKRLACCYNHSKFFSGLSLYSGSLVPGLSWIQYFNIPHCGFTALQHNEFLGQNFCPEHNTSEISRCQNYIICTGEEFLMIQNIELSSWGFWKNHMALSCIMIIFLSITYVQLLPLKKRDIFKTRFHFL